MDSDRLRASAEKELAESQGAENQWRIIEELRVHEIELRLQNEELRETQELFECLCQKYKFLLNHLPYGVLVINREGIILEANLAACQALGIPPTQVENRPLAPLMASGQMEQIFSQVIHGAAAEGTVHFLPRAHSTEAPLDAHIQPIPATDPAEFLITLNRPRLSPLQSRHEER